MKKYYAVCATILFIPRKYRYLFNDTVYITFLNGGLYISNRNGTDKRNYIERTISKRNGIYIGELSFYNYVGFVPGGVQYIEYKNGLLCVYVESTVFSS